VNLELASSRIICPYCGEPLDILIDNTAGSQLYIEDCQICCSPIEIRIEIGVGDELENVVVRRDNE